MARSLFLFLSVLFALNINAQTLNKDSLLKVVTGLKKQPKNNLRDTSLSRALNLFARCYGYSSPDTAIILSKEALALSKKTNWTDSIRVFSDGFP